MKHLVIGVFIVSTILSLAIVVKASSEELLSISIPSNVLGLAERERIASFEINISGGEITSLPNMPRGWGICIDNEPNKTAKISGNISVGAASLESKYFKDFLIIRKYEEPIQIQVKIGTLTFVTLKERLIVVDMKDLLLKKINSLP